MSADTPPTSNPRVRVTDVRLLSDNWYRLHTTTFDYLSDDGVWTSQSRETYDRGNGATILALAIFHNFIHFLPQRQNTKLKC